MEILATKKVLEKHLLQLTPALPTAFEGVEFDPPSNQMYQAVQISIRNPTDPVFTAGYHRENIEFQVFIVGAPNKGTGEILGRAEMLRQHFKKGTSFQEGNFRIHILTTPQIQGCLKVENRMVCPVIIDVTTEVSNY